MDTPENRSTDERKAAFNRGVNAFVLGVILACIANSKRNGGFFDTVFFG